MELPIDPIILLSYINTKLRDEYDSLDALCDDLGVDRDEIVRRLESAGFEYNPASNQFK